MQELKEFVVAIGYWLREAIRMVLLLVAAGLYYVCEILKTPYSVDIDDKAKDDANQ